MNILIVEDDPQIAKIIYRGLKEMGFDIIIAYDGLQAKLILSQKRFDLIIVDVMLPKIGGLDLCKQIRNIYPNLPILILTALGTINNIIEGFDAGVDDYMVKPFELRELIVRIRALLKRNYNSNITFGNTLSYSNLTIHIDSKTVRRNGRDIILTRKEFKLLEYMLNNPERVLSRSEIADKVWDIHYDAGTNFIDVYINYLRKKVDKGFDQELIHTRYGLGFILTTNP